jgi:hypothetical protein
VQCFLNRKYGGAFPQSRDIVECCLVNAILGPYGSHMDSQLPVVKLRCLFYRNCRSKSIFIKLFYCYIIIVMLNVIYIII